MAETTSTAAPLTPEGSVTVVGEVKTLGEVAKVLEALREQGITLGSIQYAAERVYWREIAEEAERARQHKESVRRIYESTEPEW